MFLVRLDLIPCALGHKLNIELTSENSLIACSFLVRPQNSTASILNKNPYLENYLRGTPDASVVGVSESTGLTPLWNRKS